MDSCSNYYEYILKFAYQEPTVTWFLDGFWTPLHPLGVREAIDSRDRAPSLYLRRRTACVLPLWATSVGVTAQALAREQHPDSNGPRVDHPPTLGRVRGSTDRTSWSTGRGCGFTTRGGGKCKLLRRVGYKRRRPRCEAAPREELVFG